MSLIKWMLNVARTETVANPANPAEVIVEKIWTGVVRDIVNFEGEVDGWNVRVTYSSRVGGRGTTGLNAWRWA